MLVWLAADGVAQCRLESVQGGVNRGPLGVHGRPIKRADVVQIDIHRKPGEPKMEDVERCPAFEHEAVGQELIAGDLLQDIEEPHDLLQRAGLQAALARESLQGLR